MDIIKELAGLRRLTTAQLRERYAEVFGEATRSGHKEFLIRKIAWRLQAQAEGDLSDRARRRAMDLASDFDLRSRAPALPGPAAAPDHTAVENISAIEDERLPLPGTTLRREYKGRTLQVIVLRDGFEYEGQTYKSLSAVAKAVTGTHWNGYHFFGLAKAGRSA